MITESQVIDAYTRHLRLKARRMKVENGRAEETRAQFEQRLDAAEAFNTIELQYLSQQVR